MKGNEAKVTLVLSILNFLTERSVYIIDEFQLEI